MHLLLRRPMLKGDIEVFCIRELRLIDSSLTYNIKSASKGFFRLQVANPKVFSSLDYHIQDPQHLMHQPLCFHTFSSSPPLPSLELTSATKPCKESKVLFKSLMYLMRIVSRTGYMHISYAYTHSYSSMAEDLDCKTLILAFPHHSINVFLFPAACKDLHGKRLAEQTTE